MTYYPIDEDLAKRSHNMMSFREYSKGSTTSSYRARIDSAREDLEKELLLCVTELQKERARMYFERYCKVLAFAINEDNRIGCMCPSVMIAGPAKFPTKKKEKQVSAWESNRFNYVRADNYLYLMKNVHNQGIQSDDPEALLKSHGFRWAPSQGAWQRQLTANGKYAAKQVIEELKE